MVIEGAIVAALAAVGVGLYKRFGRKWVKKIFDDPSTPEDESLAIDGFAQDVIKIAAHKAAEEAMREARKNKNIDPLLHGAEKLAEQFKGQITQEEAMKLVSKALIK